MEGRQRQTCLHTWFYTRLSYTVLCTSQTSPHCNTDPRHCRLLTSNCNDSSASTYIAFTLFLRRGSDHTYFRFAALIDFLPCFVYNNIYVLLSCTLSSSCRCIAHRLLSSASATGLNACFYLSYQQHELFFLRIGTLRFSHSRCFAHVVEEPGS